jgi:sugar phosphate isomerase/epimerase
VTELCFNCMNRSAFFLGDEDPNLPGQIAAAGAAGFTLVGPDGYSIRNYCERGGRLEDLARLIEDAGMLTFELPTLVVDDDPQQLRKDAAELLEIARVLRPDFLQINVMTNVDERLLDEMRKWAALFAECGTALAVEYLPWLPEIRNLESTRAMMQRLGVEDAGIIIDTWHFFFSDDSWEDLAALPLGEIAYVQFDDHPAPLSDDLVAETIGRRVMPGEGQFELDRFCTVFREKGFDGVVSCEILSDETRRMDLDVFAKRVHTSCGAFWSG